MLGCHSTKEMTECMNRRSGFLIKLESWKMQYWI